MAKRNSTIELVRIGAMIAIIACHFASYGIPSNGIEINPTFASVLKGGKIWNMYVYDDFWIFYDRYQRIKN